MLPAIYSLRPNFYTSTSTPNSTFNSTDYYEDPVVTLLNRIQSHETIDYALTAIGIALLVIYIIPVFGVLTFVLLKYGGMVAIHKYHSIKYKVKNGKEGIDESAYIETVHWWWCWITKIWFGYEMVGFENIPPDEPFMGVATHGTVAAPAGCAAALVAKYRRQMPYVILDKTHANHPLYKSPCRILKLGAWSREECVKILQEGNDILVSPGGGLEIKYSDSNYNIVWGNRKGFASVAREAKATIVPIMHINLNEAFWAPFPFKQIVRHKYAPKYFAFGIGGLPVKITSVFGRPIRCDESKSVDEIFNETLDEMNRLIAKYQRVPGSKFQALLDRFRSVKYKNDITNVKNNKTQNLVQIV